MSRRQHMSYRLAERPYKKGYFVPHHYTGKLFQQYCVDQFVRYEKDKIDWVKVF